MGQGSITLLLLVVTGLVTWQGLRRPDIRERLIFRTDCVLVRREYYRLFSSALLHADWWHFAFNAFALWMFGRLLEATRGAPALLLIYAGAVAAGSILALVLHRREHYAALGASGGVSGVVFATTFFHPSLPVSVMFIPIWAPAWVVALIFIGVSFFGSRHRWGNIGHDAHLGGALGGLGIAMLMAPGHLAASDWRIGVVVVAGILSLVLLIRASRGAAGIPFAGGTAQHKPNLRYQDYDLARERNAKRARLDALLDKISRRGLESLSAAERRDLEQLSAMFRR